MNINNSKGLIPTLASRLATSNLKHIALRGITVTDLVLMCVDLWGL